MAEVVLNNMGFNYPLVLCAFHTACNWAGTAVFHRVLAEKGIKFERRQWTLVSLLSVVSALNTVVGRVNIAVPTTFDQMMRTAIPFFVVLITTRVFDRSVSGARKVAVVPIVCGMAMAWFGEIQATWASTWVSLVCVVLQAAKTVLWSEMLTGEYKVAPLHLLARLAPMTLVQVAMFAVFRGEMSAMLAQWRDLWGGFALWVVFFTGVANFVISVCTMQATKFATPLTVSILGCGKQLLVIAFSVWRLSRPLSRLNLVGMLMVIAGLLRYTAISFAERKARENGNKKNGGAAPTSPPLPRRALTMKGGVPLLPVTVLHAGGGGIGGTSSGGAIKTIASGGKKRGTGVNRAPFWGWLMGISRRGAGAAGGDTLRSR